MLFISLASGSSGNCTLIHSEKTNLLIDCGISSRRIAEALRALCISLEDIDAVLLTHEHSDHIKGLKRLMSVYGIPVYGSDGTLDALSSVTRDDYFRFSGADLMHGISEDRDIQIGDVLISPFHIYHDAAAPLAYRAEAYSALPGDGGLKRRAVCVATDTGYFDDYIRDHMLYLDAALIEANHDRSMLAGGRYPLYLKRRIMSRNGHLCNNQTGKLISEIACDRLKNVLLGHLSRENNTPELALQTVETELSSVLGEDSPIIPRLYVAPHDGMSAAFDL